MVIKRVKKTNLFDVFIGFGWYGHTRVSIHNGHVKHISGKYLPKIKYVEIGKTIGEIK